MFGRKKAPKKPEVKVVKRVVKKVVKKDAKQAEQAAAQEAKKPRGLIDVLTEKAQNDPESLAAITRALLLEEQKEANVKLKEKLAADFGIRGKSS